MLADERFEELRRPLRVATSPRSWSPRRLDWDSSARLGFDLRAKSAISASRRFRRSVTDSKEIVTWPRCRPRAPSSCVAISDSETSRRLRARGRESGSGLGLFVAGLADC